MAPGSGGWNGWNGWRTCEPRLTVYASYDAAARDVLQPQLCRAAAQCARRHGGPEAYLLSGGMTLPDGPSARVLAAARADFGAAIRPIGR